VLLQCHEFIEQKDAIIRQAIFNIGVVEGQLISTEEYASECLERILQMEEIGQNILQQAEREDPIGWARGRYEWVTQKINSFKVAPPISF
jgi:hypothetical protein